MTTLVTAELPKKIKTIGSILGDRYTVMASVGHVHDLPSKETGLEPPTFELSYEATERDHSVPAKLKATVEEIDDVVLATDPDREGEAIPWHLTEALNLKSPQRVMFTAIIKNEILAAFAEPRPFDIQRVYAQEARHALGRIIGHRVSSALSDATGQEIGMGRVQSSAVRLVIDLERVIAAFKSTQHYGAELVFTNEDTASWRAQSDTKPHLVPGKIYLLDDKLVKLAVAIRDVIVAEYSDNEGSRASKASFTIPTLQQATGQRLKLKPKETVSIAWSLYDQGSITYPRTDSSNIDDKGVASIAAYT